MDFHGFARKELQALCKLNNVPANMTNVAMAGALSSLDNVEGLGEIMEQRSNKSVEFGTPEVPRTATRTSTRGRKPPVNVLESGGVVASSRARGRTSRKVEDGDLVEDELKGEEKTPAVASCRKRGVGAAASSHRKLEVPSMQRVYSTRRSVRLVEKQFSELCLGESVRRSNRPIKIDDELTSEITYGNIKGDQVQMDVPQECSEKLVKDEVNSSQESVVIEALNGVDKAEKVIPEECAKDVVGVSDNAVMENLVENDAPGCEVFNTGVEKEVKFVSMDCVQSVINATDNDASGKRINKDLDITGMAAEAVAAYEMVKAKSEDTVNNAVDAVDNFNDGGVVLNKADEVAIEGDVKAISMDSGDIENTPVAIEDQGEEFLPLADSDFKVTSAMENATTPVLKGQLSAKRTVIKELTLVSEDTNKENISSNLKTEESNKAAKTPYQDMSVRKLLKTLKKLTINQETEVNADADKCIAKHHAVTTPRKALQTIPGNSLKY